MAVVLPAEYGVAPTGVGGALNLTQMGELKMQLAEDAKADQATKAEPVAPAAPAVETKAAAAAQTAPAATEAVRGGRSDEMTVTLESGQGAEVKLSMAEGAKANYTWKVGGGVVNFDLHGDGGGRNASYEKGRSTAGETGVLEAPSTAIMAGTGATGAMKT